MDSRLGNEILDNNLESATVGGGSPSLVPGKTGASLQLDARRRDYIDLGSYGSHSCLGNLSACLHGLTVAMWMRYDELHDGVHFLSTGVEGVQLYYRCVVVYIVVRPVVRLVGRCARRDVNRHCKQIL